ncbi:MAG: hypothetical protein ACREPN_02020 [Rudaea sp.]
MNNLLSKLGVSALLAFAVIASAAAVNSNDAGKPSRARPATPTQNAPAGTVFSFTGTLDANTPTQNDRVFRDGIPSTCNPPKVYPGNFGGGTYRHVVTGALNNSSGNAYCATITLTTDAACAADVFATAYSGSFDVNNLGTNYLADSGSSIIGASQSESFQVLVPANGSVVFNVNEANGSPGVATCGFSLTAATPVPAPMLNLRNLILFGLGLLALGMIVIKRRFAK